MVLVDDRSDDATAESARQIVDALDCGSQFTVVDGEPLAQGWTGKLWALDQGVQTREAAEAEYLLLTDADIAHPAGSVGSLVTKAETARFDLVSLMAQLRVETVWDRMLIPAFVFFFAKLYPFRWAADRSRSTAAAAGGCVLVRRKALERAGGLTAISNELIDDCAPGSSSAKAGASG